jgi:hypothetical protein
LHTPAEVNAEASKLDQLASAWGMSVSELIETYALDEVVPGICMNPSCTHSTEVEPDQQKGWCEECEFAKLYGKPITFFLDG